MATLNPEKRAAMSTGGQTLIITKGKRGDSERKSVTA